MSIDHDELIKALTTLKIKVERVNSEIIDNCFIKSRVVDPEQKGTVHELLEQLNDNLRFYVDAIESEVLKIV